MIGVLLYRDWLNIKKNGISLLVIFTMFPMLLHLFLSIPLSNIISLDIRYLNWAAPGIWVTASGLLAFCIAILRMKKIKHDSGQLDALLKTPLRNGEIIFSVIIMATLLGLIQALISIAITVLLNNENLGFGQILLILLQIIPLINFYAILGTLLGIFIKDGIVLISIILLMFLILALSIGSFLPLTIFPTNYVEVVSLLPLTSIINSCQMIIQNGTITYIGIFLTFLLNIFLVLLTIVVSYKTFRK
jgi:ABC-type multidrug transport system permease subunit